MKVLICPNRDAAINRAAGVISAHVAARPKAVLGLATGGTMLPLYQCLVELHRDGCLSFAEVTTFNLDEYVGIAPEHPCSYHSYMSEALFSHIDIDETRTHLPHGKPDCVNTEANEYEERISAVGGITLQLLGIGQNGHIGFNEPTSSLGSRTRVKTLTENTRNANRQYFSAYEETPRYAITMGIGTILDAQKCLLLATGVEKAQAVADMVEGPLSAICPASALQLHSHTTVILDVAASSKLRLTDYYHHVHPNGEATRFD